MNHFTILHFHFLVINRKANEIKDKTKKKVHNLSFVQTTSTTSKCLSKGIYIYSSLTEKTLNLEYLKTAFFLQNCVEKAVTSLKS